MMASIYFAGKLLEQWPVVYLIENVLIVFLTVVISQKQHFMAGLDLCSILPAPDITEADKRIILFDQVIDDADLFFRRDPVRIHQFTVTVCKVGIREKVNRSFFGPALKNGV